MYRKNIEHALTVGLKYFFDFDYTMFSHIVVVGLVIMGLLKFFLARTAQNLQDGVATVKSDVIEIKNEFTGLRARWENSNSRETMMNIYLSFKELTHTKYQ